jgi:hypothetical protein
MNISEETICEFQGAAHHIRTAAKILDRIASQDPDVWARFEARLADAGAERLELVRDECDLIGGILNQEFNAAIDRDNAARDARENAIDMARKDGETRRYRTLAAE